MDNSSIKLSPEEGSLFHSFHKNFNEQHPINSFKQSNKQKYTKIKGQWSNKSNRKYSTDLNDVIYGQRSQERCSQLEVTDQLKANDEVTEHINKTFTLKSNHNFGTNNLHLPAATVLFCTPIWEDSKLQTMKADLNSVKTELDGYDIENWHQHTFAVNPASRIQTFIKRVLKPEMLTQAFTKFYEILINFPILPTYDESNLPAHFKFHSLHLCEAPGAFIVALNHFLSLNHPVIKEKWSWMGNTLNPYFEGTPISQCVSDDRLILHTQPNWFFGKDQTGNLMNLEYTDELIEIYTKNHISVQLVTADGSIDCQGNPEQQEVMTNQLHLTEVYVALSILGDNGSLVLKMFTFFESDSVNLIYFLSCFFKDLVIHKPITSKCGNSEVYVVAAGFNKSSLVLSKYLIDLRKYLSKPNSMAMFNKNIIPEYFLEDLSECCSFFTTKQITAIKRNIDLFEHPSQKKKQYIELLKKLILSNFSEKFDGQPIDASDRLVQKSLDWDKYVCPQSSFKWGEQITRRSKSERLDFLNDRLFHSMDQFATSLSERVRKHNDFAAYEIHRSAQPNYQWDVRKGLKFNQVYTSRLCNTIIMQVYIKYMRESVLSESNGEELTNDDFVNGNLLKSMKEASNQKMYKILNEDKLTENAIILDEGNYIGTHNKLNAFEQLVQLIKNQELKEEDNVVILNAPLFTRLQAGLFTVLKDFFYKTLIHIHLPQNDILDFYPIIIFTKFSPRKREFSLISDLEATGWNSASSFCVHQIVDINSLVSGISHGPLCLYNTAFALRNSSFLKSSHKPIAQGIL